MFCAVTVLVFELLGECSKGAATQPAKRDAAAAPPPDQGAALFGRLGAQCHGADGKGYKSDHAPSLVNPTFLASASDAFLRQSIVHGRPGTAMAGYGKEVGGPLDVNAVGSLIAWLRSHGGPPIAALPAVAPGDAERGKALYVANCQKCHGDAHTRGDAIMLANP